MTHKGKSLSSLINQIQSVADAKIVYLTPQQVAQRALSVIEDLSKDAEYGKTLALSRQKEIEELQQTNQDLIDGADGLLKANKKLLKTSKEIQKVHKKIILKIKELEEEKLTLAKKDYDFLREIRIHIKRHDANRDSDSLDMVETMVTDWIDELRKKVKPNLSKMAPKDFLEFAKDASAELTKSIDGGEK